MTTPVRSPRDDELVDRFDARLTSWGLTTRWRRDAALAALVALGSGVLVLLIVTTPDTSGLPITGSEVVVLSVVLAVQAALLCLRRVVPATCLIAVVALQAAVVFVLPAGATVHGPASVVAAYTAGAELPARRTTTLVAACAVGEAALYLIRILAVLPGTAPGVGVSAALPLAGSQLFVGAVLYGLAAFAGANASAHRRYVDLVRLRADEAVAAQRVRAEAAIGAERSRMARELHDIAAHHLSGMVVQAAVLERLIERDPQAAQRTAASVRRQGRETLRDLRMIVGALREPTERTDDPEGLTDGGDPVPGLADLDRLVHTARERGTPVELVRDGPAPGLAPVADVTFHRVAQEALTNAVAHAPGAAVRVTLRHEPGGQTSLEIHNDRGPTVPDPDGPRDGRGFGLVGMRERAQLIGATFDAGPTASGGWSVRITVPAEGDGPIGPIGPVGAEEPT